MTEKTLFIHAGGSKTGSSAIQNFLELNFTQLESFGYAYENRANLKDINDISSGNGELLLCTLLSEISTNNEIDKVLLSYFLVHNNAICSSESLQHLTISNWRKFKSSLDRLNLKVKIIFFIRDVIPFLNSAYDQMIKRHGEIRQFDQFCLDEQWHHYSALRNIAFIFPKENIQLIHYDSFNKNIITTFLDTVLGVNLIDITQVQNQRKVNRSLTYDERDILLKVNNIFGDLYSAELSDLLIYKNPSLENNPVRLNKHTYRLVMERFQEEVKWVNNVFFLDQSIVTVLPIETSLNETPKIKEVSDNKLLIQVLEWSFKKIQTVNVETEQRMLDKMNYMKSIGQIHAGKIYPDVPNDFDPVAYLLINEDVLNFGMDPITHYKSYGRYEDRQWRFINNSVQSHIDPSKKLFFMMIPNTVGPLLKELLANQFKPEQILMHDQPDLEWPINRISEQIKFVSGPINYIDFKEKTELLDFKVVTCLRQPLKQIIAQISHYRHYADAANNLAFEACTKEIQLLALKLAKLDLASPVALTALYNSLSLQELVIFDNPQIRFLTKNLGDQGKKVGIKELELAMRNLKSIDVVGDVDDMKAFINAVTKVMDWSSLDNVVSEKDDSEKYGMDSNNLDIANALWPFIRYDIALYSQRESFLCKPSELIDGRKD